VSVLLITHNIFQQGRFCGTISLNAKYTVALKNVRDKNQFLYLARQVHPEDSDSLNRAYIDATEKPHGYLILDCTGYKRPAAVSNQRLSGRVSPIIYVPTKDETDKIELPHSTSIKDSKP
jgi:hypothetical protein